MADLIPVRAKLERAREHAAALEACLEEYVQGHNFSVRSYYDPDTGWNELRFALHHDPPSQHLALILGDAMTNARGALDFLVWQLVLQANTHAPDQSNMFPIVRQESDWDAAAGRRLQGVADEWVEKIAELQPFQAAESDLHLLAVLDDMNNLNKHRTIPTTISKAHKLEMSEVPVTPGMEYQIENPDPPLADGAVLFRMRAKDGARIEFPETSSLVYRVGFDDATDRQWDTADLLAFIEKAINSFEPAFAPTRKRP